MTSLSREEYDRIWSAGLDYARHNPGGRHRRRMILELLGHEPFSSLLEVGCGGGFLLSAIRERFGSGPRLTGADLSGVVVESNRNRLPEMRFEALDIQSQAPSGRYDVVICSEVIEHLTDRAAGLAHLAAALEPRGRLLLTFPIGPVYATDRAFGHTTHPTLAEIERLAGGCGLVVEQARIWGWPFFDLFRWAINLAPDLTFKEFGGGGYGPSKKLVSDAVYRLSRIDLGQGRRGSQALVVLRARA